MAAYYNGGTATYSLYPNGQNTITTADANYSSSGSTNVGRHSGDPSSYGTFDQGGNVWEWNDAVIFGDARGLRGGGWGSVDSGLQSSYRADYEPRVPEPTSVVLAMVASGMLLIRRKR